MKKMLKLAVDYQMVRQYLSVQRSQSHGFRGKWTKIMSSLLSVHFSVIYFSVKGLLTSCLGIFDISRV